VAAASLELTQTLRGRRAGSLLWLVDKAETAMGSRALKGWIERPLIRKAAIDERLDAGAQLKDNAFSSDELREALRGAYDIERLLSKIAYDTVNARDCLALFATLRRVPELRRILSGLTRSCWPKPASRWTAGGHCGPFGARHFAGCAALRQRGRHHPGGVQRGVGPPAPRFCRGQGVVGGLERREREATGIKNLKVGYIGVFGYYIEVTKSFYDLVPYRYTGSRRWQLRALFYRGVEGA
jgi:DNA mismatch repair protein MutS